MAHDTRHLLHQNRARYPTPRITRCLERTIWQVVKGTIAAMPRETNCQIAHAIRVRWLVTLLYLGGLRIAEVGTGTMANSSFGAMRMEQCAGGSLCTVKATRNS